jgi:signal transduction histidine kinase
VDSTKKVARNLLQRLRPAELDRGILTALNELSSQFSAEYGVNCDVKLDRKADNLADGYGIILYRVMQESLTNIARHAKAENVEVILQERDDGLMLMITDDGEGFDNSKVKQTSYGLAGIHERLLAVGGELEISSELQKGTRIIARLPTVEMSKESESD